jgi:hypothetical protein
MVETASKSNRGRNDDGASDKHAHSFKPLSKSLFPDDGFKESPGADGGIWTQQLGRLQRPIRVNYRGRCDDGGQKKGRRPKVERPEVDNQRSAITLVIGDGSSPRRRRFPRGTGKVPCCAYGAFPCALSLHSASLVLISVRKRAASLNFGCSILVQQLLMERRGFP